MDTLTSIAVLPGLYLMWYVYRQDKIEKEPLSLLTHLAVMGALGVFIAMFAESVLIEYIMKPVLGSGTLFLLVENFLGVALVEEYVKFRALQKLTWQNPEFDYRFDAIVYAVAAGMGFAILENVFYVFEHGFEVAVMRAFTSLPGHCVFAIYMGYYYGEAKLCERQGNFKSMNAYLKSALWVPTLIHGTYDFCLSGDETLVALFFVLLVVMDVKAYRLLKQASASDRSLYY